jgi:hypothetical protein
MHRDNDSARATILQRRSFICNAGAALSATIAGSAVAAGTPVAPSSDAEAIRKLHWQFVAHLNAGEFAPLVELFAADAEVHLWGGVFRGKEAGVRRLYEEHFARHPAEGSDGPVQTFLLGDTQHHDVIDVASDRQRATGRFHCLVRVECVVASPLPSLAAMARQQGAGILQWWESGVLEGSYVRLGGEWRVGRLEYGELGAVAAPTLVAHAPPKPRTMPTFTRPFPENPTGPDRLLPTPERQDT